MNHGGGSRQRLAVSILQNFFPFKFVGLAGYLSSAYHRCRWNLAKGGPGGQEDLVWYGMNGRVDVAVLILGEIVNGIGEIDVPSGTDRAVRVGVEDLNAVCPRAGYVELSISMADETIGEVMARGDDSTTVCVRAVRDVSVAIHSSYLGKLRAFRRSQYLLWGEGEVIGRDKLTWPDFAFP